MVSARLLCRYPCPPEIGVLAVHPIAPGNGMAGRIELRIARRPPCRAARWSASRSSPRRARSAARSDSRRRQPESIRVDAGSWPRPPRRRDDASRCRSSSSRPRHASPQPAPIVEKSLLVSAELARRNKRRSRNRDIQAAMKASLPSQDGQTTQARERHEAEGDSSFQSHLNSACRSRASDRRAREPAPQRRQLDGVGLCCRVQCSALRVGEQLVELCAARAAVAPSRACRRRD